MKTFGLILAIAVAAPASMLVGVNAAAAADAAATVAPVVGKMLYSTDGKKLATVYKLDASGAPQVLLEGKLFTIPVSTLTEADGKTLTSLTKKAIFTR